MKVDVFGELALRLPRLIKRLVAILNDVLLCAISVWFSYYLRIGEFTYYFVNKSDDYNLFLPTVASVFIAIPIFILFGFYRSIFRYSGWVALMTVVRASVTYGLVFASLFTVIGFEGVPRTIGIIQPILLLLSVGASRALVRFWLSGRYKSILSSIPAPRILIYGAGVAGRELVAGLSNTQDYNVVGFLDDNQEIHGQFLNGIQVYNPDDLPRIAEAQSINKVILAIPSASRRRRCEIIDRIRRVHVEVHTLPSISDLIVGNYNISDIKELDVYDLLGREPIEPNNELIEECISNKIILVTGAGGSIGSELSRQIIKHRPSILLILDQSEHALYNIHQEIVEYISVSGPAVIPLLGSVCDELFIKEVIDSWRPNIIYHAAAYKHVPLVEHNLIGGIKNNVFGTLIIAKIAKNYDVDRFVLISTDKAVRPTNIMGASKRLSEMTVQALNALGGQTKFSIVRFGNVLDSSGSVVPKFRHQIRNGGPITITHPEVTRYFMTIPEAVQLVLNAGAMAQGGEVFLLDMGSPVKIIDLALRMIELSGFELKDSYNPRGDIEIEIIGLRPGEKLYEELLIGEASESTDHNRILKSNEIFLKWELLEARLAELQLDLNSHNINNTCSSLHNLVHGYNSMGGVVDWIYLRKLERQSQGSNATELTLALHGSESLHPPQYRG